jgi:cyclophilin family peptidyl-prolyl cis-trans isomerase
MATASRIRTLTRTKPAVIEKMWRTCLASLVTLTITAGLHAAESEAPATQGAEPLRAEITTSRGLYSPNRPIWVRFTLYNISDQPVEIPLHAPPDDNGTVALPLEIVLGTPEAPALCVAYRDEKPVHVPAPAPSLTGSAGTLRLGPRAYLGLELDLREHYRALRYSGTYRLEWRPLNGRAGTAGAEFQVEPRKDAIIVTDKGKITCRLLYDAAPRNVEGFLELVKQGFYDGKPIHRIVPGFLIQAGCPKGDGTGIRPDGKLLPAEFHDAPFLPGTLAMARKPSDPNSASCQFFITLARLPELDGQYTVIGQASDEESLRTLNAIAAEPTDRNDRPRLPVVIRSINLVSSEEDNPLRVDLQPHRPAASSQPAGNLSGTSGAP